MRAGTWTILTALAILLAIAFYVLVEGWSAAGDPTSEISTAGYVAMALGILVTLALGMGLMALIFYSNRRR